MKRSLKQEKELQMKNNLSKLALILTLVFGATQILAVDSSRPDRLVKTLTEKVVNQLKKDKPNLGKSPVALNRLARKLVRQVKPHWDLNRTASYIIGAPWRKASRASRRDFIAQFENILVRTYSKALLQYSDQKMKMAPYRHIASKKEVKIKSKFLRSSGSPISVVYSLYKAGSRWKIYNVKVAGFNLISNFKSQYRPIVKKSGLAGLNKVLKSK